MKITPLLNDETIRAKLLLQKQPSTKIPVGKPEAIGGCNCDRWGHPCPGCDKQNGQSEAEPPISVPVNTN